MARRRTLLTLAIETSCDDTAVAVLSRSGSRTQLLFNERVTSDNRASRGINPRVAIEGHNAALAPLVRRALAALPDAADGAARAVGPGRGLVAPKRLPDLVAATRGPGSLKLLGVGLSVAKGLALAWGVPLLGVHHMQAHALTPWLASALGPDGGGGGSGARAGFPQLTLLMSGGHTQLVRSASLTEHAVVVDTRDQPVGNMLDQAARCVLPPDVLEASPDVMYGRDLEAFAFPGGDGDDDDVAAQHEAFYRPARSRHQELDELPSGYGWTVSPPFRHSRLLAFSFSGVYAQVDRITAARPDMDVAERRALARHTLRAAFDHIASRLCLALALDDEAAAAAAAAAPPHTLVVSGGVARNRFLAHVLRSTLAARGFPAVELVVPPPALCTDNAAMIAWTASEMFRAGWETDLSALPINRWPMDPAVGGGGLLGVEGWLRREATDASA